MLRPNKFISILVIIAFFLNTFASSASACWWKGTMLAHGSPEVGGAPNQGGNNTGQRNQETFAEPIYLHNGDFFYEFNDLSISSRGLPVELKHIYKSQSVLNNRFGCGWDLSFNQRIVALANGDAYYFDGSNMRLRFNYLGGKNYVSPAESYDSLIQNTDGTWTLTKKHGENYYFNQNGLITKIEDRNKNAITFSYNPTGKLAITGVSYYPNQSNPEVRIIAYDWQLVKVTDTVGREIALEYDENGRLKEITDFSGRKLTYTYDINGDLKSITRPSTSDFPSGITWQFSYTNHKLNQITDPKGQTYLTNYYNGQGLVDAQETGGNKVYINYDLEAKKTEVIDGKSVKTVYTFNGKGNPIQKEGFTAGLRLGEPASYVTTYEYNNHLELTKVTYPKGNSILYTYDELGNLLEIRRKPNPQTIPLPADIVSTFTYEPRFNFIKTLRDPKGNITTYYYDYDEATLSDLNGDGITNQDKGNLVKITYPVVGTQTPETKFTYNSYGQVLTVTDPNRNITKYEYNSTGYLAKATNAFGSLNLATEMTYDSVGNVKTLKDPKANTTTFEYDSHNNLTKTTSASPFNYNTTYKYDANDNLAQIDRQTGNPNNPWQTTYYTYDLLDRLQTIKDELGNITTFSYDANGNRSQIKDAELNSTNYEYDERNLLWRVTDVLGNATEYTYDENGNLKEIKDVKANKTSYDYDDFDRLKTTTYMDTSTEEYTYDLASNLKTKKDPKNQTITYDYDGLNRLVMKGLSPKGTVPDSEVGYAYDLGSRLTGITDVNGTINYSYDAVNRVKEAIYPLNAIRYTLKYEYDNNSNRSKLIYPDSTYLTYEYDELNRLKKIKDQSGQAITTYNYDALSRRTQLDLANSTQTTYTYDDINRLTKLKGLSAIGETVPEFTYTYDKAGNRLTQATLEGAYAYGYDKIYQLTKVTDAKSRVVNYGYDAAGNRTKVEGFLAQGAVNYTANSLNQYTQAQDAQGITPFTYDKNGNLTSDGTNAYTYDYENRLIEGTVPERGLSLTYKYDAFGRRIRKEAVINNTPSTINYVYDGDQIIAEYDGSGNLITKYIYGTGIDEVLKGLSASGETVPEWFYHYDGLGSVTELTNSSGTVVEKYEYDAYGKTTIKDGSGNPLTESAIGNRFGFTGREYDTEIGLYYYRSRYYSPAIGRFLQRDPFTWGPNDTRVYYDNSINSKIVKYIVLSWGQQNPRVFNYYTFCINNPINYLDPFGLAYRQKRPLERTPWTEAGPLHHDSFRYNDGSNSGYYNDSRVHDDKSPLRSKYKRASNREFDDDFLKQSEKNVQEWWLKEPYDVLEHNCWQYADEVEKEYDKLEKEIKEKDKKPSYKKK